MDENKFWITVWKLVLIGFCVMILSFSGCTMHNNRIAERLVNQGADPVAVRCMLKDESNNATCIMSGMK